MIAPEEIKKKALRQYEGVLTGAITGDSCFPMSFPIGQIPKAYPDLLKSVTQLIDRSKSTVGAGYRLVLETRNTRKHGPQSIPQQIYLETMADYLALLQKEAEFSQFCSDVELIQSSVPALSGWIRRYPLKVIERAGLWADLLKVCDYFQCHPQPNLYIRELPIAVHTKFIEEQQEILRPLLEEILPEDQLMPVEGKRNVFEKRFSLKYSEPLLRLRILDPALQTKVGLPVADISLTVSDLRSLQLGTPRCFVTENLMPFLTLPLLENSIAIFGAGYANQRLKTIDWLAICPIFYWGDMDVDGFKILNQMRSHFPQTQSILMDWQTYENFQTFAVSVPVQKTEILCCLTDKESALYAYLTPKGQRLEQERINQAYVNQCVQGLRG